LTSPLPHTSADPIAEYEARLAARRASLAIADAEHRRTSLLRLATFVAGLVIAWLALDRALLPAITIVLPVLAFVGLVLRHGRIQHERDRYRGAVRYYERGIARLDERWPGTGTTRADFVAADHPYAADLDLFGHGSLFDLVCDTRTQTGERLLASWLAAPADPATIRARQAAVTELRPRLDLREELAASSVELRAEVAPDRLVAWGARPATLTGWTIPVIAGLLSLLTIATLVLAMRPHAGISPFIVAAGLQTGFLLLIRTRMDAALRGVDRAGRELTMLRAILLRLESEQFASPLLTRLAGELRTDGVAASRLIRGLQRRIELNDSGRNLIFLPVSLLLLWPVQLACVIDRWRAQHGAEIARWIAALAEIEALGSLAGYAYEHPADVFPEIVTDGPPRLEASAVGHPLLLEARCVRNDLVLDADLAALVVSGSNMSGKSTMLRAVGLNVALALAGAPVRAARFRLTPLAIGASIRINDSLLDGRSHFQAEILRLKQITDLARGALPLLFLLDEILHGTNSHDRCIGSEAVIFHLLERGAIGLVTTHDLALAQITPRAPRPMSNVHFADHVEDGAMHFDYQMRDGVVQKSNALALMRAAGLEV
jgi:hypothetical protein